MLSVLISTLHTFVLWTSQTSMLQLFRNSSRNWFGKALTTTLFGLLIFSFSFWGIADWIANPGSNNVVTIGNRSITIPEMREAYLNQLQALQRQLRTSISPEQAQAIGLDRQVLGQLLGQAILDNSVEEMQLAVPDNTIVNSVMREPQFRDGNGKFNRLAFDAALQNAGITEKAFVNDQRAAMPRRQIAESITGDIAPISAMQEMFHRFAAERRNATYAVLSNQAAGTIDDPDDATLEAWFNERKPLFRLPEYRGFSFLVLDAETLAKPEDVTRDEALARYEAEKTSRYGTPETRHIQQLVFQNAAEAEQAHQRLIAAEVKNTGNTFKSIANERKLVEADYDLGLVTKHAVFDPAVAEVAFTMTAPGISKPVAGRFGTVIVRVVAIAPPYIQEFKEVEEAIRLAIAVEKSRAAVNALHDRIENGRAVAKPLEEIASENGLILTNVKAIDRTGHDDKSAPVADLPDGEELINAVFASDIGADNAPLRQATSMGAGYIWYDVTNVTPNRERTFAEAREDVLTRWRAEATADKLANIANSIVKQVDDGAALKAIVGSMPRGAFTTSALQAKDIARNEQADGLSDLAVGQIFATHKGKAGSVTVPHGRLVFQVTDITVPAFDATAEKTKMLIRQLHNVIADDMLAEYINKRQMELRPILNEQALRAAINAGVGNY